MIVVYIDGSFVNHKISVKPIYITVRNLNSVVSGKAYQYVLVHTVTHFLQTSVYKYVLV
jgi:hypothetical protein